MLYTIYVIGFTTNILIFLYLNHSFMKNKNIPFFKLLKEHKIETHSFLINFKKNLFRALFVLLFISLILMSKRFLF